MRTKKLQKVFPVFFLILVLLSCQNNKKEDIIGLINDWKGRSIHFPSISSFTIQGRTVVEHSHEGAKYKILSYVDSIGCISCKLHLVRWESFIKEVDSISDTPFLFYFHPKDVGELKYILLRDNFSYPVCIDKNDTLNKMNHFPDNMAFQTFLLDKENKVVALGNPIHNPRVKELYLDIIQGKQQLEDKAAITVVEVPETTLSLGSFPWEEEQKASFTLKNVGEQPLHIEGVTTSCDCTTVEYAKAPVPPGATLTLLVKYRAEKPEPFYRAITIYCNTPNAPLELEITGEGK